MKHKRILLVLFFLSLFFYQQAQAGRTIPSVEKNPSQISSAFASTGILPQYIHVYMYKLENGSGEYQDGVASPCQWPLNLNVFGCGQGTTDYSTFPQMISQGLLNVNVEQEYLPNVLPNEMDLIEIPPDPTFETLKAQAIASRTVGIWKSLWGPWDTGNGVPQNQINTGAINNSYLYQTYNPGSYNMTPYSSAIHAAVTDTSGQFLRYTMDTHHAIDAEFFSDVASATTSGDVSAPYLKGVNDPISVGNCVRTGLGTNTSGMSQRGAIRWAIGNTCPDGSGGAAWPVKWDYKQILAHYYTGVEFIDINDGSNFAPDYRWNLLNVQVYDAVGNRLQQKSVMIETCGRAIGAGRP